MKKSKTLLARTATSIGQDLIDNMDPDAGGYFHLLSPEEKDWLLRFNSEYYLNNLTASDPEEQLHKGDSRRACYNSFNSRRQCLITRNKSGRMTKGQTSDQFKDYINRNSMQIADSTPTEEEKRNNVVVIGTEDVGMLRYKSREVSKSLEEINKLLDKDMTTTQIHEAFIRECLDDLDIDFGAYEVSCLKKLLKRQVALMSVEKNSKKEISKKSQD